MLDVISIGGATRDIFFEYDLKRKKGTDGFRDGFLEIPYGEKLISQNTYYSYGGGAINTAVAFSRLGLKSAAICNLGSEGTGTMVVNFLEKEGVNTKLIRRDHSLHTGLSVLIVGKDGEHTGFLERGANNHLIIERTGPLKRTRWFYISSLTGNSADLLPALFNFAAKHKIKIAFNPGRQQLAAGYYGLKKFLEQTEILLLNSEEAEDLVVSKTKKIPSDEKKLVQELLKMGSKTVVVTEGARGSFAANRDGFWQQRAFSEKIVDTTGAGDSFGSTFVFGVIKGFEVSDALKLASVNAASVVAKMGASGGLLTYNTIRSSKWL